jgi:hypothetical protein
MPKFDNLVYGAFVSLLLFLGNLFLAEFSILYVAQLTSFILYGAYFLVILYFKRAAPNEF